MLEKTMLNDFFCFVFIDSATYTLQVPNVTKTKLIFQVSSVRGVHL